MTWPEAALAIANVLQVIALAWIAGGQRQVKGELHRVNGDLEDALATVRAELAQLHRDRTRGH